MIDQLVEQFDMMIMQWKHYFLGMYYQAFCE